MRILVEPFRRYRNSIVTTPWLRNCICIGERAYETGRAIRDIILDQGLLTEDEINHILSPKEMTRPGIAGAKLLKQKVTNLIVLF